MAARTPWIKLWLEARTDRKLDRLSDAHYRVWSNLLLYSAEQDPRGSFAMSDSLAIEVAKGKQSLLDSAISAMVRLGLICDCGDGLYIFPAFEERQAQKPSDSKEAVRERVRRHREKLALLAALAAATSSGAVESAGVSEEPSQDVAEPCNDLKRHVTRDGNEEVEGEVEVDQTPQSSRSPEPERKERGSYPQQDDPTSAIGYAERKLDRALTHDERRSVKRWVKLFGSLATTIELGEWIPTRGMDLSYIGTCIANHSKTTTGVAS